METQASSSFPIHKVPFSNGIVFYWTIWGIQRIPLIKYGDIFVPVGEHHTRIFLAIKLIAIAEFRMNGIHPVAYESTGCIQGLIMGQNYSCQKELDWGAIVFSDEDVNFKYYHDLATDELVKMMTEH